MGDSEKNQEVKKCESRHRIAPYVGAIGWPKLIDVFTTMNICGTGEEWPVRPLKHLYECDICYRKVEDFYGKAWLDCFIDSNLRGLIKKLKDKNIQLSGEEFLRIYKNCKSIEEIVPNYAKLVEQKI